jgi:hygromycin-B 7''-O-kinase
LLRDVAAQAASVDEVALARSGIAKGLEKSEAKTPGVHGIQSAMDFFRILESNPHHMSAPVIDRYLKLPAISHAAEYESCFRDDIWKRAAAEICRQHRINYSVLRRSPRGENIVFLVDKGFVIKIFAPFRDMYSREALALRLAHGKLRIKTPEVLHNGEIDGWSYLVTAQLAGRALNQPWASVGLRDRFEILSGLGAAMKQLHSWEVTLSETASDNDHGWRVFLERQIRFSVERQRVRGASPQWVESLPTYLATNLRMLPADHKHVLLHGDLHPGNFLLEGKGRHRQIAGLIDFADSLSGFHEYDFIKPVMHMAFGNRDLQRTLLLAYGYKEKELDLHLRRRLMLLTILHEGSNLRKAALRLQPNASSLSLEELEAEIWSFA